jgi:hypothetical protein
MGFGRGFDPRVDVRGRASLRRVIAEIGRVGARSNGREHDADIACRRDWQGLGRRTSGGRRRGHNGDICDIYGLELELDRFSRWRDAGRGRNWISRVRREIGFEAVDLPERRIERIRVAGVVVRSARLHRYAQALYIGVVCS